MKKTLRLSIVAALLGSSILVSPSAIAWSFSANIAVSSFSGTNNEEVRGTKVDRNGNIFTTGLFFGTVDFDPSDGITNLTALGDREIFVSKIDSFGNLLWAKRFGGVGADCGNSITLDSSGNVYIAGNFSLTADFDPGTGIANLTAAGLQDMFILKLDSSGNYLWAKSIGGSDGDDNATMALDSSGNALITGRFFGTVDFDPGLATSSLVSSGNSDIFILKLDSSGNYLWAKSFGDVNGDAGNSIAVDGNGFVYTTGQFRGTIDFDSGSGTTSFTAGSDDVFISKLDSLGNYVWAKSIGGSAGDYPYSINVDIDGNVYTAGQFAGTADFDPGLGTSSFLSKGSHDIFVSKLDSSGNYLWAKSMGGEIEDVAYSLTVDSVGNVSTTGRFKGTADFDPGLGTFNLVSNGLFDVFISKLDSSGNYLWAKSIGGLTDDTGRSITTDTSGNVYAAGSFTGTVDLNPGLGTSNFTSIGEQDVFILKLDAIGIAPLVAVVSAGEVANSKVAAIPSGVTEAAIARTNELPAIKLNFGGAVPTAVTVAPVTTNPAPASVTPFVLSKSPKIVDIQLSGSFSGSATVCLDGSASDRLYHFTNGAWVELGSQSYFNGQVCGVTTSFSPFTAAAPSPIPTAPSSVVATVTGKRSATVNFTTSGSNGGSVITSYTATSTPGGITKTLVQATGGTFTFEGLQPSTSYTFDVTATNANGTSAAFTSNAIKTTTADIASLTSVTFTDDGTGTAGKLTWSGKNIDSVLYTGPASSYPGPFNFGAFTSSWNGSIRNLTPETSYTISIYAISVDGNGESKSLTFKTGAKTEVVKNLAYWNTWLTSNTYFNGEAARLFGLLNKFSLLETSPHRSFIKVPTSRLSTVTATSLTPKSCSVVSATAKVDAGLVKALTKDTCTISYTVSGPSKAPATLVKDFVFKKVS